MNDEMGRFCARLGADPLLVQGAGGNVSWKDGNSLWVTASGARLLDGGRRDVFVRVDRRELDLALRDPRGRRLPGGAGTTGRASPPSIETWMHGVLPHRVVAHLHAVEALAILVRRDALEESSATLGDRFCWEFVEYHRPGARLAEAVARALGRTPTANVIFLRNHGLIVAGDTIDAVEDLLAKVLSAVKQDPAARETGPKRAARVGRAERAGSRGPGGPRGYSAIDDAEVQSIAHRPDLYRRLSDAWALYPDQVVFLGAEAQAVDTRERAARLCEERRPPLLFIRSCGVFARRGFDAVRRAQLRCYYEILARQKPSEVLVELEKEEVKELVEWDAEAYRRTRGAHSGER